MDAKQAELEEKLAEILDQAADVASQIQAVEQGPGQRKRGQVQYCSARYLRRFLLPFLWLLGRPEACCFASSAGG